MREHANREVPRDEGADLLRAALQCADHFENLVDAFVEVGVAIEDHCALREALFGAKTVLKLKCLQQELHTLLQREALRDHTVSQVVILQVENTLLTPELGLESIDSAEVGGRRRFVDKVLRALPVDEEGLHRNF